MLYGDHAAAYGIPCLVTAVDIRYYATIQALPQPEVVIQAGGAPAWSCSRDSFMQGGDIPPHLAFVGASVRRFAARYGLPGGVAITTHGPDISFGLGSSSAVTAATFTALAAEFGQMLKPEELFDTAYAAVLDVQGLGSGFDVAAALLGGTLLYRQGNPATLMRISHPPLPLLIGYTGAKVGTVSLVASVKELYQAEPRLVSAIFSLIEEIVPRAQSALQQAAWPELGRLANLHQGLLESLGVSTLRLAAPIYAAREAGAFGAKLSGAGGGDCMFAWTGEEMRGAVAAALERAGAKVLSLATAAPGARIEPGHPG